MDAAQEAFNLASDLDKQLLTLATAVLTLSATFRKEFDPAPTWWSKFFLISCCVLMVGSIALGLLTMGKLTSISLKPDAFFTQRENILDDAMPWAAGQELSFLGGMSCILVYIVIVLRKKKTSEPAIKYRSPESLN